MMTKRLGLMLMACTTIVLGIIALTPNLGVSNAGVCLSLPEATATQQDGAPAPATARLQELLDKAGSLTDKYKELFRDLTAEESKTFEIFDKQGKLSKQRRTVADLIVYQSQQDPQRVAEYRNIREVDGAQVKKQGERVEKLFERLSKADSLSNELARIHRESTRYDFGYEMTNYTILNGVALWKQLRTYFKYELVGNERLRERETAVVKFEQKEFVKDMFGLHHYEKLNVTGPLMRGQYWLDPETGRLLREHHEIFFRDNAQPRTFKAIEVDYDFVTSEQGIWLPQRVVFQYFNPLRIDNGIPVEMYRAARITSEFGTFRRFEVKARYEDVPKE